jgi:hypothetical protein
MQDAPAARRPGSLVTVQVTSRGTAPPGGPGKGGGPALKRERSAAAPSRPPGLRGDPGGRGEMGMAPPPREG